MPFALTAPPPGPRLSFCEQTGGSPGGEGGAASFCFTGEAVRGSPGLCPGPWATQGATAGAVVLGTRAGAPQPPGTPASGLLRPSWLPEGPGSQQPAGRRRNPFLWRRELQRGGALGGRVWAWPPAEQRPRGAPLLTEGPSSSPRPAHVYSAFPELLFHLPVPLLRQVWQPRRSPEATASSTPRRRSGTRVTARPGCGGWTGHPQEGQAGVSISQAGAEEVREQGQGGHMGQRRPGRPAEA